MLQLIIAIVIITIKDMGMVTHTAMDTTLATMVMVDMDIKKCHIPQGSLIWLQLWSDMPQFLITTSIIVVDTVIMMHTRGFFSNVNN